MSGIRPNSFFRPSSGSSSTNEERTPLRGRQHVTLSSEELNKIFDAFNSISKKMKKHLEEIQLIKESQTELLAEVKNLSEDNKVLHESLANLNDQNMEYDSKIPPEISVSR